MDSVTGMHPAVAWLIGAAAVVTAIATIYRYAWRPVVGFALEVRELVRDLTGYPGRPGYPSRPGMVETVNGNSGRIERLARQLDDHLAWSRNVTGLIESALHDHMIESERTRQEAHKEAAALWEAVGELAKLEHKHEHDPRPPDARTRRDDEPRGTPNDPPALD